MIKYYLYISNKKEVRDKLIADKSLGITDNMFINSSLERTEVEECIKVLEFVKTASLLSQGNIKFIKIHNYSYQRPRDRFPLL